MSADLYPWASPALKARIAADLKALLADRGLTVPDDLPADVLREFVAVLCRVWVDGTVVGFDQFHIDPADEGLLFGRGLWESTRTVDGAPWLWPLHVERLALSAELLHIDLAPERIPTAEQVTEFVRSMTYQDVVVRVNVSAGRPGQVGMVWMTAAAMPVVAPAVTLKSAYTPVAKGLSHLTLKTFQYASRLNISQQARDAGFDSALMLDADGNVLESAHANIFFFSKDGWITPQADGGFLPGTVRRHLMTNSPSPIREAIIPRPAVGQMSEAFVTNSNVGIVPVTRIDDIEFAVGPETRKLLRWIEPTSRVATQYRFQEKAGVRR
jgi:branched-subunit amino acid aminotransferase/4-amino-4-deoxychorismate lyase